MGSSGRQRANNWLGVLGVCLSTLFSGRPLRKAAESRSGPIVTAVFLVVRKRPTPKNEVSLFLA